MDGLNTSKLVFNLMCISRLPPVSVTVNSSSANHSGQIELHLSVESELVTSHRRDIHCVGGCCLELPAPPWSGDACSFASAKTHPAATVQTWPGSKGQRQRLVQWLRVYEVAPSVRHVAASLHRSLLRLILPPPRVAVEEEEDGDVVKE
eukprot:COSAG01_NODE_20884_length_929_cov_40.587952_1_plen_149_part_00